MSMRNRDTIRSRLSDVRSRFDEWGVEALYVDDAANRRWLCGFTGSAGQALVTRDSALLSTDFRYWERAGYEAPEYTLFRNKREPKDTAKFLASAGVGRIGFSAAHMTVAALKELEQQSDAEWVPLAQSLEPLRCLKVKSEIASIREAAAITDRAMAMVNELASPGMSERALAWELEKQMRESGADALAFHIIVASGPNSALPHYRPGVRELQSGDVIVIDMGAEVEGYKSDLTRSFYLGEATDDRFSEVYSLVLQAHDAAVSSARPGLNSRDLDAVARDLIDQAAHGADFGHGLGHGVGLEIHEAPSLSSRAGAESEILLEGMMVTIEPGIYLPGWGGIRIEDLILITEDGCELISRCPYNPYIPILQ